MICDRTVVGQVLSYVQDGKIEVSYWIGREHWGRGLATAALKAFLGSVRPERPLHARAVKDNLGALWVLEKCGFHICGEGKGFAYGRGAEVEESVLGLDQ